MRAPQRRLTFANGSTVFLERRGIAIQSDSVHGRTEKNHVERGKTAEIENIPIDANDAVE